MKRGLLLILVFSLFLSCTGNTIYEKPKDLIPRDSMVLLLKDLYLAAAAKNVKNKNLQRRFSYAPLVYEKYQVDSARFHRSNFYYTSKIDLIEPMLNEVKISLEADRAIYAKQKKVRDSIIQDSLRTTRKMMAKRKKDSLVIPNKKMNNIPKKMKPQALKKKN